MQQLSFFIHNTITESLIEVEIDNVLGSNVILEIHLQDYQEILSHNEVSRFIL